VRSRLILITAFLAFATPAFAAEPVPGDACATANAIIETGGPETSGIRHILRCDGSVWKQEMTIDASGNIGIGTASPGTALDVNGDIKNRNITSCSQLGTDSTGKIICQSVAPTSAMSLISTQTASGTASLQFTGLPSTYNTVFLNCAGLLLSADEAILVQVGAGATPTWKTSNNYSMSSIYTATAFDDSSVFNTTTNNDLTGGALFSDSATNPLSLKLYLDNIGSSSITKLATYSTAGSKDSPASSYGIYTITGMGFWKGDTNPVTAIRLITTGGNITAGTCSLYGMI
jgi:hypothetical protein